MRAVAACLALAAVLAPADEDGCRRCDRRGVVDCENHEEALRALETAVLCSVAAACEPCGGALVVDCEDCEGGPENAAMEARRAELAAWAAVPHPLEAELDVDLMRVETDRFALAGAIDELEHGRRTTSGHAFLHHLARDATRVAQLVADHYEVDPEADYRARMRLWFWQDPQLHARVMREHLLSGSTGDYKLLGKDPIFSVCTADPLFEDDHDVLLALGVHNAAHMLTSNLFDEVWIGLDGAGWFDVGLAHWYEREVIGRQRHYCVDEAHGRWGWTDPLWRAEIRKLLKRRRDPVLPGLFGMQTGEVPDEGHALSFSFYDWMVAAKPGALRPILAGLKRREPARDLLREHLGLDPFAAEEAWRAWVDETYPLREKYEQRR